MIGKDNTKSDKYYIVSKDKGYQDVIDFWNEKYDINVQLLSIRERQKVSQQQNQLQKSVKNSKELSGNKIDKAKEKEFEILIKQCKGLDSKKNKSEFYKGCVKIFGQEQGTKIYKDNLGKIKG